VIPRAARRARAESSRPRAARTARCGQAHRRDAGEATAPKRVCCRPPAQGLLPLAILAAAAWWLPRLSGARGGVLALGLGVFAGGEACYDTREVGASGDDCRSAAS
jgi:hypothetical protein